MLAGPGGSGTTQSAAATGESGTGTTTLDSTTVADPMAATDPTTVADSSSGGGSSSSGVRQRIVLDTTDVTEDLAQVPILVRLGPENVAYQDIGPGGVDLRFFADDGVTGLPFEVERWNDGMLTEVWVRLPAVAAAQGQTTIYLSYGASDPPPPLPSADVWSAGYIAVWHLPAVGDATGNGHDLAPAGIGPAPQDVAGVVGRALRFNEGDAFFETPHAADLMLGSAGTVESWVSPVSVVNPGTGDHREVFRKGIRYRLATVNATSNQTMFALRFASGTNLVTESAVLNSGQWQYLVGTLEQTGAQMQACVRVFPAPPSCAQGPNEPLEDNGNAGRLGSAWVASALDEVRISGVVRSASWLALQARSLQPDFATFDPPEPLDPP